MFNPKNLKIVKTITKLKRPHVNWIMFSKIRDYKIKSNYVDLICNNNNENVLTNENALRNMVEQTLMREFSSDVKNMKSYDLLVNAVIENIKSKHRDWASFIFYFVRFNACRYIISRVLGRRKRDKIFSLLYLYNKTRRG